MAAAKMAELLGALNSADNSKRQMAETMFQQAKASEPDNLLLGFVGVLEEESIPMPVRTQGAVLLRQMVSRGSDKDFVFSRVQPVHKQTIAAHLLSRFEAITDQKLQSKVGDVICKLADSACDEDDQRGWLAPGQRGWPQVLPTVFRLANAADTTNTPTSCESSVRLLANLVAVFKDEIVQAQQQLGAVVQAALAAPSPKVRCAAFVLVCELVGVLDKKAWAPLVATASVLTAVLQQLGQANLQEELEECLQQYLEVANLQPDFFKSQLQSSMEPVNTLATFVKTRSGVEEGIRKLSLEWLVTYAEQKPKWLAKSLPAFIPLTLECCFYLMLEIEDGEAELKEWVERMDDEEGEEDKDELYHEGESAIDRVVEAITIDAAGKPLLELVGKFSGQQEWQARLAALTAVKQTVEYVEEEATITQMAQLLFLHLDHPHPRVRYTALHALGQLSNDQAPDFQDKYHSTVMPVLLQKMEDPIDRVASMAMSAFVSFGEELENALMIQYSGGFMQKLVSRLQTSKHRMVQEESITSIAVIAGVIEKDFSQYYDGIMPLLKQLVLNAKGEKENRLRGKAFECMSLLGLAVGKEKFLPDAQEAVGEMLKTPLEADDLQREYIQEASERICKCLKQDFAPFLPHLLPGIFASLKMEAEDASNQVATDQEDMEYITVSTGEGKLVKVRTSKFVEMEKGASLLNTYCVEMEGAFYDCIPQTAEALLSLLSGSDEITMLCNEARNAAFQTWASLIKCARMGAKDRGMQPTVAADLLRQFLRRAVPSMQSDDDPEGLQAGAEGLAECLRNVGPGVLGADEVRQIVEQIFKFIDDSFKRTLVIEKEKQASSVGAPPELAQDDDEEDAGEEEEACRRAFEDALGAVMEVSTQEFLPCMTETCTRMQQWLGAQHKTLALFLACDMLQHLKEYSAPAWPVFMDPVFQALVDKNPDVRIPAAYAISLAAPIPQFSEAAPRAFQALAQLLSAPAPKKKDEQAKVALDNCVSAMFALAKEKPQHCPPEIPAWQLVVSKLPLRDDEDEAKKIHKAVTDLLLEQHQGLLGQDNCHIGKILSCLAEVYKQENFSTKECDAQILRIFQMLPRENLQQLAAGFSEKQQRKIEKMLTG